MPFAPLRPSHVSPACPRPSARWLLPVLALLALAAPGHAATLNVPADYATIQAAVNATQDGDTVLIADGTYSGAGNRDIDFNGKNLTITSQNGPTSTIIDCGGRNTTDGSGNHRGFYLHSSETKAVISGVTVKNGYEQAVSGITDSGRGGGIYVAGSSAAIQNCILSGNTALYGGGLYNYTNAGPITLAGCTLIRNTAQYGGGIYNYNYGPDTITLAGCAFTNNTVTYNGGGILNYNYGAGTITLTGCTFTANAAVNTSSNGVNGNGGGALNSNYGAGTIALTGCLFTSNTSSNGNGNSGGGVYNVNNIGGTITLTGCTFTANTASNGNSNGNGGGIYNSNTGTITLTGCTFANNAAPYGGGINNSNAGRGTTTLTGCTFTNNTATYNGGGVYNGNNGRGTITLANCTLAANSARYGGGVYDYDSTYNIGTTTLINCTLTANTASNGNGGGIYNYNTHAGTIILINDIAYGDTGGEVANLNNDNFYLVPVNHCDVQGGYSGTGNIDADPLFVSAPADLHLQSGSPCLGAGTSAGAPATDKDGSTRPNPPSIGAYEPVELASLTFASPVPGGTVLTATVTLSSSALTDTVVGLSSSESSVVRVHRAVVIPAGSRSATFTINTYPRQTTQTVTIQASLGQTLLTKDLTITGP